MRRKVSNDPYDIEVGSRVRRERLLKKITQEYLAERLGITFQQIQKYENGTNRISISRLVHICQVLQTDICEIVKNIAEASTENNSIRLLQSATEIELAEEAAKAMLAGHPNRVRIAREFLAELNGGE